MHQVLSRSRWPLATALVALGLAACGGSSSKTTSSTAVTTTTPATTTTAATTTAAPPQPTTHKGNNGLVSVFGAANQLLGDPVGTLTKLKALGVQAVRIDLRWNTIAPDPTSQTAPANFDASNPNSYNAASWAPYDNAIGEATAQGIRVMLTVGGPAPLWAEQPGDPMTPGEPQGVWKPQPAAFAAFVHAVGTRYSGTYARPGTPGALPKISLWGIWNEPNYGADLQPQATGPHAVIDVSPSQYRGLLNAAWDSLQATGHSHDTILFGDLAPHGQTDTLSGGKLVGDLPGKGGGMVPLRFLRGLYCVNDAFQRLTGTAATQVGCPDAAGSESTAGETAFKIANPALFQASGLAMHLYLIGGVPPNQPAPHEPDFADLSELGTLETTLDRLQAAYGSKRKLPIWNDEFGYHTDPPEPSHLSPTKAAVYLNQAEYMSWRDPRVRSYDQYELTDPPIPPGAVGFETGLLFVNGSPKPGFAAYRMPLFLPQTSETAGGKLEVWGCARPAPDAYATDHTPQKVAIQFAAGSGTSFTTLHTISLKRSCYFDTLVHFPRSGTVRLDWLQPTVGDIQSRSVAVTVHGQ